MARKGPKPKRICKRGHDTSICGRNNSNGCKACARLLKKKRYKPCKRKKNQFCSRGHNKDITGKDIDGTCKQCKHDRWRREYTPRIRNTKKQFCVHGHDTFIVGRTKKGVCKQCHREDNGKREKSPQRKEYKRQYAKKHPEVIRLIALRSHVKRKLRIPKFGQRGISNFYINCPKEMEIDHIIPLLGEEVSGLHVRWNLQYLMPIENATKRNKCNLLAASEWYGKILEEAGLK